MFKSKFSKILQAASVFKDSRVLALAQHYDPKSADIQSPMNIKELITALFDHHNRLEFLLFNFFVIPSALDSMPLPNAIAMTNELPNLLIEQLPWFACINLSLNELAVPLTDVKKIKDDIQQYHSVQLNNIPSFTLDYICTIFAYLALDILLNHLPSGLKQDALNITPLINGIRLCRFFLEPNIPEINSLHHLLSAILRIKRYPLPNDEGESPPSPRLLVLAKAMIRLEQANPSLKPFSHIEHVYHLLMNEKKFNAKTYAYLSDLLFNPHQHLPSIFQTEPGFFYHMTHLILSTDGDQVFSKKGLILLKDSLRPPPPNYDFDLFFDFMYGIYKKYSSHELVRNCLACELVSEEFGPYQMPDRYPARFVREIIKADDIRSALTFCMYLSICPEKKIELADYLLQCTGIKTKLKKSLPATFKNIPTREIASAWRCIEHNPRLPATVYILFNELFGDILQHHKDDVDQKISHLCELLKRLNQEYRLMPLDTDYIENMICLSESLLRIILLTETDLILEVLYHCQPSNIEPLLIALTSAEPLASLMVSILKMTEPKAKGTRREAISSDNYLSQLSKSLDTLISSSSLPYFPTLGVNINPNIVRTTAQSFLVILVLLLREKDKPVVLEQNAWKRLIFSMIKQILLVGEETPLRLKLKVLFEETSHSQRVNPTLRESIQKFFIEVNNGDAGVAPPYLNDAAMAALCDKLSWPDSTVSPKKTKKKKKSSKTACAEMTNDPIEDMTKNKSSPEPLMVTQELALTKSTTATSPPPPSAAKAASFCKPDLSSLASQPAVSIKLLDTLYAQIKTPLNKMAFEILNLAKISHFPPRFEEAITQVDLSVKTIRALNQTPHEKERPSHPEPYHLLSQDKQKELESKWNETLSRLCWSLRCELGKCLQLFKSMPDQKEEETDIAHAKYIIEQALLLLSDAYFKNPNLYICPEVMRWLNVFVEHLTVYGDVSLNGSHFSSSNQPQRDYDLFINPKKNHTLDEAMAILDPLLNKINTLGVTIQSRRVYQTPTRINYCLLLLTQKDPMQSMTLAVDINFSLASLSLKEALEDTKNATLTMSATHWHLSPQLFGGACMDPEAARATNCGKLVLNVFNQFTQSAEEMHALFLNKIGYFLKTIIKYPACHLGPCLSGLLKDYIHPNTRLASAPNAQMMIHAALNYLFDRFAIRTEQTIKFINHNQLLPGLYPELTDTYPLCLAYFNTHFKINEASTDLSAPCFLAMFFMGTFIDQPTDFQNISLQKFKTMLEVLPQKSMSMALHILNRLRTTADLMRANEAMNPQGMIDGLSFKESIFVNKSLKMIAKYWVPAHPILSTQPALSTQEMQRADQSSLLHSARLFTPRCTQVNPASAPQTNHIAAGRLY